MQEASLRHLTLQIVAGTIQHTITAFLVERRSRNLSPKTLEFYTLELKLFNMFLNDQGVSTLDQLNPDDIRRYLLTLAERRNGGGCHAAFRSIRALLLWAWEEYDQTGRNPMSRVSPPKKSNRVLPGVPLEDVSAMIEVCQGNKWAKRDKAILLSLLDTGARDGELAAWTVRDLDISTGTLVIRHGKGDKQRTVYVGKRTRRAIMTYLRSCLKLNERSPLFATDDGENFSVPGLRSMIRRRATKAGVNALALHAFRRAFALAMLRGGADVFSLQRLMGHADLSVLRTYLAQNDHDLRSNACFWYHF